MKTHKINLRIFFGSVIRQGLSFLACQVKGSQVPLYEMIVSASFYDFLRKHRKRYYFLKPSHCGVPAIFGVRALDKLDLLRYKYN